MMAAGGSVHLDASGGVAGDMFVAAMLDACPELTARVMADLAAVLPPDYEPRLEEGQSDGIVVRRFRLAGTPQQDGGHDHHHDGPYARNADHHHGTSFAMLAERIARATCQPGTAEEATAILCRLAEAEASVHGVSVGEVHFHELADWDSLMDVVAAGSIAAALTGHDWSVSELPRGGGLVRTRHGLLPIPAPATAVILRGFAWRDDGIPGERVTPTGAAILAHLVNADRATGILRATGIGAGTRELPGMPNILRALVFQAASSQPGVGEIAVLSFDIDDMTGEEIGIAADRLRAEEAVLDLSIGMRQGKKGRLLYDFCLLVRLDRLDIVGRICMIETSTIGLRWRIEQRLCLDRWAETTQAAGMVLRRKRVRRPDGQETVKVESDDVAGLEGLSARRGARAAGERESGPK